MSDRDDRRPAGTVAARAAAPAPRIRRSPAPAGETPARIRDAGLLAEARASGGHYREACTCGGDGRIYATRAAMRYLKCRACGRNWKTIFQEHADPPPLALPLGIPLRVPPRPPPPAVACRGGFTFEARPVGPVIPAAPLCWDVE